jgi:hypothetical protein
MIHEWSQPPFYKTMGAPTGCEQNSQSFVRWKQGNGTIGGDGNLIDINLLQAISL